MYEVVVVGAGPAGLTAGLYTSRAGINTLILEKETIGGELTKRDLIEDYPGYPDGVLGPELSSYMAKQVINYGTKIEYDQVEGIEIEESIKVLKTSQTTYRSKAIIIAGGVHPKKLGVPGEEDFAHKGVFYCATCDGPLFTDKVVALAGGGDSGLTEALFLARMVSKVIVIEVLPHLTATKSLQEKVFSNPKIEIECGAKIEAICGGEQVEGVDLLYVQTGRKSHLKVDGVIAYVGFEADTYYLRGSLALNERGQILVNEKMQTEVGGIFAVGDIRHNSPMRIVTAVGDGATAALSVAEYLGSH